MWIWFLGWEEPLEEVAFILVDCLKNTNFAYVLDVTEGKASGRLMQG